MGFYLNKRAFINKSRSSKNLYQLGTHQSPPKQSWPFLVSKIYSLFYFLPILLNSTKNKVFKFSIQYVTFFLVFGIVTLLIFGGTLAFTVLSTSVYNYIILGGTCLVQFLTLLVSIWLLKNVKTESGMIIEYSLSKFKSEKGVETALKSNVVADQRAGKLFQNISFLACDDLI